MTIAMEMMIVRGTYGHTVSNNDTYIKTNVPLQNGKAFNKSTTKAEDDHVSMCFREE